MNRRSSISLGNPNRTILALDQLESREVPAVVRPTLDLTKLGASGTINGAIFSQYDAHAPANAQNGRVDSFLRIDDGGSERGYNSDARPLQFDESRNRNATHSIRVSDLPLVNIGGVNYRELVLDVNEPSGRKSKISLDELQIFVSNNPKLHGYNDRKDTLGGLRPVYEMGANRWVSLDASLNHQRGTGDMIVGIPDSVLQGGTYLALYSRFGVHQKSNGASEQWGPGFGSQTALPTGTISGFAFLDQNPNGQFDDDEFTAPGYEVKLYDANGDFLTSAFTNSDGSFSFTVELSESTTYLVSTDFSVEPIIVTLSPGGNISGIELALPSE